MDYKSEYFRHLATFRHYFTVYSFTSYKPYYRLACYHLFKAGVIRILSNFSGLS